MHGVARSILGEPHDAYAHDGGALLRKPLPVDTHRRAYLKNQYCM